MGRDASERLVRTHGGRWRIVRDRALSNPALVETLDAETGVTAAEIEHAVIEEMGMTLADVLIRRTPVFHHGADQGLPIVERVADLMANLLDWSEAQRADEITRYRQRVDEARRWKS